MRLDASSILPTTYDDPAGREFLEQVPALVEERYKFIFTDDARLVQAEQGRTSI
jgi:hypothetical protein